MRRPRTLFSRFAAVATWALGLSLATQATRSGTSAEQLLLMAGAMAAVAGAVKMWWHNCFESHLVVVVVLAGCVVGSLLSLTVGSPMTPRADPDRWHGFDLGLALAVGALLVGDARVRDHLSSRTRTPYAR